MTSRSRPPWWPCRATTANPKSQALTPLEGTLPIINISLCRNITACYPQCFTLFRCCCILTMRPWLWGDVDKPRNQAKSVTLE